MMGISLSTDMHAMVTYYIMSRFANIRVKSSRRSTQLSVGSIIMQDN